MILVILVWLPNLIEQEVAVEVDERVVSVEALFSMNRRTPILAELADGMDHQNAGFPIHLKHLDERLGQFIAITEQDRMLETEARVGRHLAWLFHPVLSPRTGPTIEITQEELALLAGVSRPVAARALQSLAEEGLITIEHASVTIHDFEALSRHL